MVIRSPDQRTVQGGYAALDDRMLVLDFQAGHPEAFVEIHRRYGGLARHVCQRFLPNQADADEAFQETMIHVFQGLYRFNGRYALRPWIARIAKNVSLDILRGRARRPQESDQELDEDSVETPDEADLIVERLVQRDTVLEILAVLPEPHRRALVLREIDGRSHREIAKELDITSSQAKALLHRARGNFRRRWLEMVADGGGLKGMLFLPLLWLARVGGSVRRLGDRAGQAVGHATQTAQAAMPETVTSMATSAAPAAASVSERILAAGMTLLVAGGVTVGAAKIVQDRSRPEASEVAAAAAAVVGAPEADIQEAPEVAPAPEEPRPVHDETPVEPVVVEPSPSEDPAVEPIPSEEPTPPPSPSEEPTPPPSPSEEPPPPPPPEPPAYGFAFEAPAFSGLCPCLMIASPVQSSISASGDGYQVRQSIDGRAVADGEEAFDLRLEYDAAVAGSGGSLTTSFYVATPNGGWYAYLGTAAVVSATETEHGTDYTLQGAFQLQNPSDAVTDEMPASGSMTVTLSVWDTGEPVLVGAGFSLSA